MKRKKSVPSEEATVRKIEKMVGVSRKQIARVIGQRQFACAGCGRVIVSDGTVKTKAFVWTRVETKKKNKYCYSCDDKLIQGVM